MQNRLNTLIVFRTILIIGLFLMVSLISGFGISCQPQAPAPSEPSPGLPKEPTSAAPSITEVLIEGFAFKPAEVTLPVGSTITWRNEDAITHTVTAQDKVFDSGSLSGGAIFSYMFEQKGTLEYYCAIHSYMNGKVIVE